MIELELQVTGHSHGESETKDAWYAVTLKGKSLVETAEVKEFKLTLKGEDESIFRSYPIHKTISLKLHDPQRKLAEAST